MRNCSDLAALCVRCRLMARSHRAQKIPARHPHSHRAVGSDVSMEDYQQHLASALVRLSTPATAARNIKSCDPALIGADDRVSVVVGARSEQRLVRYGWLRVLFSKAEDPDEPAAKATNRTSKPAPGAGKLNHLAASESRKDSGWKAILRNRSAPLDLLQITRKNAP